MYYDKEVIRLEREQREASRELAELLERAAEAKRKVRAVQGRLTSTTKHENWHCRRLAAHLRDANFEGEHAEAIYYVRQLKSVEYLETLQPFIRENRDASILAIEHVAVMANLKAWTELGKHLHWDAERRAYEEDFASFQQWQAENPDETSWRDKPATRRQYFLIWRTATQLDLDQPTNIKRGEAHDWLAEHDANLRFRSGSYAPAAQAKPEGRNV